MAEADSTAILQGAPDRATTHENKNGKGGRSLETGHPPEQRTVDKPRLERAVREMLLAIDEDPEREGLRDTPRRIAESYEFLFSGLVEDPAEHLRVGFREEYREMVLMRDIPFCSVCEHHFLPIVGKVHVGYVPDGRVVGLSKLARVVEGYARRPQLQERLTAQVADALYEALGSRGSIVVVEAEHMCLTMRGVQKPGSVTVTNTARGLYATDEHARREAITLMTRR
ncbi:GTP cyclohydrolase I FolE [soil metagenome]